MDGDKLQVQELDDQTASPSPPRSSESGGESEPSSPVKEPPMKKR